MATATITGQTANARSIQSFRLSAAGLSALFALRFVVSCWRSLTTHAPTWVDGPILDIMASFHSGRVYQLSALKTTPYTVLTHTPLSYLASYAMYRAWPGFAALRLVDVFATLGCAILIFRWVQRRTGNSAASIFSACAFLLMPPVFQWAQVTRSPDSFCCFFSLAVLTALESRGKRRHILIGLLIALAFLSKQTAVLTLFPTVAAWEYMERRSLKSCMKSLAVFSAIIIPVFVWLQWYTHGGFWLNVVTANSQCAFSLAEFRRIVMQLLPLWIFAGCALGLSGKPKTPAHLWAIVTLAVGFLTCGKLGADTMYFFDASAAVALLSGIALSQGARKTATTLLIALLPCALVFDAVLASHSGPAVQTSFRQMVNDLRPFPTVLTDEASIDIETGRPWYWGDPMVLGQLENVGKWNPSFIESGLANHRFAAVVVWNPSVWSHARLGILLSEYHQWRTYKAFKGNYVVYLPNSSWRHR